MNLNPMSWIRGYAIRQELAKWSADGLIQPDQQRRIDDQYDRQCCGVVAADFAKLALYGVATASVVLAFVLVIADHWREIYLPVKISLAVLLMAVAHGTGYWYRFHDVESRLSNPAFVAGSVLFGCAMLLAIDQYYAASPLRATAIAWVLFAWSAGTLPLAWVIGSTALLVLTCLLGTAWVVCLVAATGNAATTSLFVAMDLCLLRWCYVNRSRGLFIVAMGSLAVWWGMMAIAEHWGRAGVFWLTAPGPLLILTGLRHDTAHPFAPLYKQFGTLWSGLAPLALSMPSVSHGLVGPQSDLHMWLLVLAAAGVGIVFIPAARRFDWMHDWAALAALASVTIVPAAIALIGSNTSFAVAAELVLVALFNAGAIAVVIWLIRRGAITECVGSVATGIAYSVVWAILISFDLSHELTCAALIFTVAAAALLLFVRLRLRKQESIHEPVTPANP